MGTSMLVSPGVYSSVIIFLLHPRDALGREPIMPSVCEGWDLSSVTEIHCTSTVISSLLLQILSSEID